MRRNEYGVPVEPAAVIEDTYGSHLMIVECYENDAQVTVYDHSSLRFPLMWSRPMSKKAAHGALELFRQIGYYDAPIC
jgi:hypothetical protein